MRKLHKAGIIIGSIALTLGAFIIYPKFLIQQEQK